MEITLLEDPACSWCWAFQPVITAMEFELLGGAFRRGLRLRRVMGGLRDRPLGEASYFARHCRTVEEISGMPFDPSVGDHHVLRTTFEACRAVKAALSQGQEAADRYLRRIREAFHLEGVPIDDRENLLELARDEGLDAEALAEDLQNGRAEMLFDRDRREAAQERFGFPTLLIRKHPNDLPIVLNGVVGYGDVLQAIHQAGCCPGERRRFDGRAEDWDRLFSIHRRLTGAELVRVTRLDGELLERALAAAGVHREGFFYVRESPSRICPSFSSTVRSPSGSAAGNLPPG